MHSHSTLPERLAQSFMEIKELFCFPERNNALKMNLLYLNQN